MHCAERRSVRSRKVSKRIGAVSAAERENVTHARLEALENDDAAGEGVVGDSDEEFLLEESDEGCLQPHAGTSVVPHNHRDKNINVALMTDKESGVPCPKVVCS